MKELLEKLQAEDSKKSLIKVPLSLLEIVNNYQAAYKARFGRKISRENVMLLMLSLGKDVIQKKADALNKDAEAIKELI